MRNKIITPDYSIINATLASSIMGIDLNTLQILLDHGNLNLDTTGYITSVIFKAKERKVLEKHQFKISEPFKTGNRIYFTTRATWLPSKKIGRGSYSDLIDALYEHYFEQTTRDLTVQEVYEAMINDYERSHLVSALTIAHYRSDWTKYIIKKDCFWLNMPI